MKSTASSLTSLLREANGSFPDPRTTWYTSGISKPRRSYRSYRVTQMLFCAAHAIPQRTSLPQQRWKMTKQSNCGEATYNPSYHVYNFLYLMSMHIRNCSSETFADILVVQNSL